MKKTALLKLLTEREAARLQHEAGTTAEKRKKKIASALTAPPADMEPDLVSQLCAFAVDEMCYTPLHQHLTKSIWPELAKLHEDLLAPLCAQLAERFEAGVPKPVWSKLLFLFSAFQGDLAQSLESFRAQESAVQDFRTRAALMEMAYRLPSKLTPKFVQKLKAAVPEPPGHVARVVTYAGASLAEGDPGLTQVLLLLLAVDGGAEAEQALRGFWQQLSAAPPELGLTVEVFEGLVQRGTSPGVQALHAEAYEHLAKKYAKLPSVRLLQHLSDKPLDHTRLLKGAFYLAIPSTNGVYEATIKIHPGDAGMVRGDPQADWLLQITKTWEVEGGRTSSTDSFSRGGPVPRHAKDSGDRWGVAVAVADPSEFPQALATAAQNLGIEWDTSPESLKGADLRQRGMRIKRPRLGEWLRSAP